MYWSIACSSSYAERDHSEGRDGALCRLKMVVCIRRELISLKLDVWIDGETVSGPISEHPAFRGIMQSQAELYDLQGNEWLEDVMTYPSPLTG
jgi:hypothetical protein